MSKWKFNRTTGLGGRFQLIITRGGYPPVDVTTFRGAPTQLGEYSNGDPFGDGAASFTFPKLTVFDDLNSLDVGGWLAEDATVDLWWVPAGATTVGDVTSRFINPLTGKLDVIAPGYTAGGAVKAWEGFIASIEVDSEESSNSIQIQCQGALYQGDCYLQKPYYPPRPQLLETLIHGVWDRKSKPHLRTGPLSIHFPAGWTKRIPAYSAASATIYTPDGKPGTLWTGYSTRNTGGWDRAMTGFAQDLLAVMLTQDDCGAAPGNQWTVQHQRQVPGVLPGRTPVLTVRDRYRPADFSIWAGTPGLRLNATRDATQSGNIIYGDGTGIDGTVWRNAIISNDGSRTDYKPLAASPEIYPYVGNKQFNSRAFAREVYQKYGSGFNQDDAINSAAKTLGRDEDPGWSGTATLSIDPSLTLSRFLIRAGMTMNVKGFMGTGESGTNFHIAEVNVDPDAGTATLKIDTRYRDLLNLEESLARTRDPLTPSKLLQVNRASVVIEDILAPWDYNAGAGYVPKGSKKFHDYDPVGNAFPSTNWAEHHPPFRNPNFYVRVNASASTRAGRWTGPVPILTSEKGSIRRTEFACYDKYGKVLKIPFHVSLYYFNVTVAAMPRDSGGPSPFITGAFESINTATGLPWPTGNYLKPDPSMIIAWGNYQQRAGFSPGRETDGAAPTGLLVDEGSWSYDNTFHTEFKGSPHPHHYADSTITIYAMFYAAYTEPVYFMGRLFRDVPGT